jgi:hypothetical protein
MKKTYVTLLACALAAVALMGWSCNPFQRAEEKVSQKVGDKIAEEMVNKATGGKVNINSAAGQVEFKDSQTGNVTLFGENVTIPDDFPKDVPLYPGVKVTSVVMEKTGDKPSSLGLKMTDDVDKVVTWYAKTLKEQGWSEKSSFNAGEVQTRVYTKPKANLSLTASKDTSGGTFVMLVRSEEKADDSATEKTE